MSGNATSISMFRSLPIARKTLRYAFGIALSIAIAYGFNWPLSFLIVLLVHSFLLGPKPSFKTGIGFITVIVIAVLAGIVLSNFLLGQKYIYLTVIAVVLLNLYYADQQSLSPVLKMFLIIFVLIIPLLSLQTVRLGSLVGATFIFAAVVSMIVVWLVYAIFPDLEIKGQIIPEKVQDMSSLPTSNERFVTAIKSVIVVFPLVVLFYFFSWQNSALILIYVGMYSSIPGFAKDFSKGKGVLFGCITGGIIAFLLYELVVMVPMYSFLILLFFAVSLLIGNEILTEGRYAELIKAGFSTVIIIFGSAVSLDEVDAGGKIISRVIQISIVVIYMVLAFGLIEKLFPSQKVKQE